MASIAESLTKKKLIIPNIHNQALKKTDLIMKKTIFTTMKKVLSLFILLTFTIFVNAQDIKNNPGSNHGNKFEQLGTILPTPNEYRTASGAPGPQYWQQRCDYDIVCELDEPNRKLSGK